MPGSPPRDIRMNKKDIFYQLDRIDKFDLSAIEDEEFYKAFNPYLVTKWLASTSNPKKILLVNDLLNCVVLSLHKEKKLLYYLACASSTGPDRYKWTKRPSNKGNMVLDIISRYHKISQREAKASLSLFTREDIIQMAEELGLEKKELDKLKKLL